MALFPELPEVAFVELSLFTGDALKTCVAHGVTAAVFVGLIGKMVKTAQGHMQTHVAANQVDLAFLADICRAVDAPPELAVAVAAANTARHFMELCLQHSALAPLQRVVDLALVQCRRFVHAQGGDLALEVVLVDFDGRVLARASDEGQRAHPQLVAQTTLIERLAADPAHAYDDEESIEPDG
jgi:cobalt-precorrin-5B (C1)-methyltransferase